MNNVLKGTGYGFDRMTKEEVFQAWECFIDEEKSRKYSACIDSDYGQFYVSVMKAFRLFVNSVSGFVGTKKEYCKTYNVSEEYFDKAHHGEYTTIYTNSIGEEIITENELAKIFKIKRNNGSELNWCKIIRNFSEEEGSQPALPAKGENHE